MYQQKGCTALNENEHQKIENVLNLTQEKKKKNH